MDVGQVVTLVTAVLSTGTLMGLVNFCINRATDKIKAQAAADTAVALAKGEEARAAAVEIDTDVLESKFRTMLYGENDTLRKDLNEAHDRIRKLQKDLLAAEMTIGDMIKQHMEEMIEVRARLKLTEERLTESERARSLLQVEHFTELPAT